MDRRLLLAIAISPVFLLSKARKHFFTIGYTDEDGNQQAMVFRVDKNGIRAALVSLEARTGVKINTRTKKPARQDTDDTLLFFDVVAQEDLSEQLAEHQARVCRQADRRRNRGADARLLMSSLEGAKLFIVTENQEHADMLCAARRKT